MRLVTTLCLLLWIAAAASADTVRVAAAISLRDAMADVAKAYHAETGDTVEFTFGSSGQLAAQIKNGAPVDAFISAANRQVDDLSRAGLVLPETRRVVAGNALVLVVPAGATVPDSFAALSGPSVARVAIGEPGTVPAGQYAAEVLEKLGLTGPLAGRVVYGSNVRQVLDYLERGEVSAGIVYATDAKESGDRVKVVATAPTGSHEPIVYPGVVVKASGHADAAKRFLDFLATDSARAALAAQGFTPPPPANPKASTSRRAAP